MLFHNYTDLRQTFNNEINQETRKEDIGIFEKDPAVSKLNNFWNYNKSYQIIQYNIYIALIKATDEFQIPFEVLFRVTFRRNT